MSAKAYIGVRNSGGSVSIRVQDDEGLTPLKHVVRHSPTGLEWGYLGSGPSDLALSILTDLCGTEIARSTYMAFKQDFIAKADAHGFFITETAIRKWLKKKGI